MPGAPSSVLATSAYLRVNVPTTKTYRRRVPPACPSNVTGGLHSWGPEEPRADCSVLAFLLVTLVIP